MLREKPNWNIVNWYDLSEKQRLFKIHIKSPKFYKRLIVLTYKKVREVNNKERERYMM